MLPINLNSEFESSIRCFVSSLTLCNESESEMISNNDNFTYIDKLACLKHGNIKLSSSASSTGSLLQRKVDDDADTNIINNNISDNCNNKATTSSVSILDDPEALWIEDKWDEYRIAEAESALKEQTIGVSEFWKNKYTVKAGKYWHEFYKRNQNRFYKDRHYLHIVFPELDAASVDNHQQTLSSSSKQMNNNNTYSTDTPLTSSNNHNITTNNTNQPPIHLLEVGCGVGNAAFPLLESNPNLFITGIDFAPSAVQLVKSNPLYAFYNNNINNSEDSSSSSRRRLEVYVCDITQDEIPVAAGSLDLILCMYVLSAIPPEKHGAVLQKLATCLKPNGKILLRDYGRYDEAQLRFKSSAKINQHQYVRQDGTLTYYFNQQDIINMVEKSIVKFIKEQQQHGTQQRDKKEGESTSYKLQILENEYITRQYANRLQKRARYRVWIQAKFILLPFSTETDISSTISRSNVDSSDDANNPII